MADDRELFELYKHHQVGENKYTYFLLATAAAAIAFAIQKADGLLLSWWLLPAGAAIISWGISFYFGCKNLIWVQSAIYANYNFLQLRAGVHPDQPPHPKLVEAALSGVNSALSKNLKRAEFFAMWQFRLLVCGAIFFVAWRVIEMIRATYAA